MNNKTKGFIYGAIAAASYGIFKNFEERGDAFRDLVFEL